MSGLLTPEQLADYLEIKSDQFLELLRPYNAEKQDPDGPEG
jgi:hypothetical protein